MNLFGAELRRLRRRSGLSQETLAARAGLSPEAVSLLERGRRSPRMTTMRLLAEGLSLPESDRSALFASVNFHEPSPPSLPVFADHPVGRDAELRAVAELIERDDTRLLTLLGPAGVGKTRIAVGYASTQPVQFPDGALVPDRDTQRPDDCPQCAGRGPRRTRVAEDQCRGDHRSPAALVEPARDRQRGASPGDLRRALPRHPGRSSQAHHLDNQSAPHRGSG
jgi:transcriptional regulator with XRE-family HTH domain